MWIEFLDTSRGSTAALFIIVIVRLESYSKLLSKRLSNWSQQDAICYNKMSILL